MELRLAIRRLRLRPGATIVSIATLAFAIGAAVATWSLIAAVLFRPLPVRAPDRLVELDLRAASAAAASSTFLYTRFVDVRDSGVFDGVAAGGTWDTMLGQGEAARVDTIDFVGATYFDTLGITLPVGRAFSKEDDRRGAPFVAVLSDRYWRSAFAADSHVVGETIVANGKAATIIGVAPPGFRGLSLASAPMVYMPLHQIADLIGTAPNFFAEPVAKVGGSPTSWLSLVGRLPAGADARAVVARLQPLFDNPDARRKVSIELVPVNVAAVPEASRPGMRQFSELLLATVVLLLLIGCLTVGTLLLIRTEARRGEFAMCLALGATRSELARGVALEGALLSITGAMASLPVAWWLLAAVREFQLPGQVDLALLDLSIDRRALLVAVAGAIVATLTIALVAGAMGLSADVADVVRSRTGATPRITRRRTRAFLVIAQVSVALLLLTGAGVFARSLITALSLNTAVDARQIATTWVSLGSYGYSPASADNYFDALDASLLRRPSIAATAWFRPFGGMSGGGTVRLDAVPTKMPSMLSYLHVDPHYFRAMGLPVVHGRGILPTDVQGAPRVIVVSQSFGALLAPGSDPVGHHVTESHGPMGQPLPVDEVVGVVPDVITSVTNVHPLVMYQAMAQQDDLPDRALLVHASGDPSAAVRDTVAAIKALDRRVTPPLIHTIDDQIALQMVPQQFGILILGTLGGIAILLTLLGAYVLAESMATVRRREMGIRAALGATGSQLGAIVLGETARLVGIGLVVGLGLAWLAAGTIRALLFQTAPLDPATLTAVAATILIMAFLVSLRPALRAARVDLASALREE